jgi:hypothetical protein
MLCLKKVFDRVQNPKKGQALTEEEAALSNAQGGCQGEAHLTDRRCDP